MENWEAGRIKKLSPAWLKFKKSMSVNIEFLKKGSVQKIRVQMVDVEEIFNRANQIVIDGRSYYDIGAYQFEQFISWLQDAIISTAVEMESLQMSHWYGPSYLVPADLVEKAMKDRSTQELGCNYE